MPVQLIPIEAHERTVGQIFDDAYAFGIPAYQRPYAWEIDQVRELLNDLLSRWMIQTPAEAYIFLAVSYYY